MPYVLRQYCTHLWQYCSSFVRYCLNYCTQSSHFSQKKVKSLNFLLKLGHKSIINATY
jgi:hypothetical protein